jgi:hypothetical protein
MPIAKAWATVSHKTLMPMCTKSCAGWPTQRRLFGYRRLRVLLRWEAWMIVRKNTHRPYNEEGFAVWRQWSCKRAVGTRAPGPSLALPNYRCNRNFMHGQMAPNGEAQVIKVNHCIIMECLADLVNTPIPERSVLRRLILLIAQRSLRGIIVSETGTELL